MNYRGIEDIHCQPPPSPTAFLMCGLYIVLNVLINLNAICAKKHAWKRKRKLESGQKSTVKQTGTNLNAGCVLPNWLTFWPIWIRCRLKLNDIWRIWMFWSLKLNRKNIRFTKITRTWMTYNVYDRCFDEFGRENLY